MKHIFRSIILLPLLLAAADLSEKGEVEIDWLTWLYTPESREIVWLSETSNIGIQTKDYPNYPFDAEYNIKVLISGNTEGPGRIYYFKITYDDGGHQYSQSEPDWWYINLLSNERPTKLMWSTEPFVKSTTSTNLPEQKKKIPNWKRSFVGEPYANVIFIESANDRLSQFGWLGTISFLGWSPSIATFEGNEFSGSNGWGFDNTFYLSTGLSGLGWYASVGYVPGILPTTTLNDSLFYELTEPPSVDYVLQDYDIENIQVTISSFHYGFGYQNTFDHMFLGIGMTWYANTYSAEEYEKYSFNGLDEQFSKSNLVFKIGWSF
ncbi:MAG: hypothetical protein HQ556_12505 [Candidatus Marinimicrobia bacterium]|nr:hypothetical protein [Candidatus Neomarinimicrobiota bacterium]